MRTRGTGLTLPSGGARTPTVTPFSVQFPTREMASSPSSLTLPLNLLASLPLSIEPKKLIYIYEFVCDSSRNVNICNGAFVNNVQSEVHWPETERWLQRRHAEVRPGSEDEGCFRILGYQWRALRFNDDTRQSTVKVMAAYRESEPGSVFLMQQPHCLAVPCNPLTLFLPFCNVLF